MDASLSYSYSTDTVLWDDFLNGNKAAYAYLYGKYAKTLYNYGYKIAQNREMTEDCLQDLFLTILETRERLGRTDSIKFYLMRALRRDIVRKLTREQRFDHELDTLDFKIEFYYEPTWLDAQISQEQSTLLLHELNSLPARQKEALFLKYFDNLSYEEIAGVMGIEQSSVYKIVYKAIASLQKRMALHTILAVLALIR
ncbi:MULTISPECIES: RNA polymerase sigma factor [Spirosoma]|uniref:Sigma-70 family RNA polymerase sigma factor n=1 Tax=Spirosoma liriopis TaxID=2937440 RepID=A0ABT0HNW9_9BACT|nr:MULTISPECIES: sigma-70 family RNA polymerase sigma factor [Spirosoma]MCK8493863.1 sigma-70 family RNA polymerase sigma factor [Spirosoma liriopis]UHG93515.1 sigma-70 family RNA polymerase sigma factor [Spirosoma oryzicola]